MKNNYTTLLLVLFPVLSTANELLAARSGPGPIVNLIGVEPRDPQGALPLPTGTTSDPPTSTSATPSPTSSASDSSTTSLATQSSTPVTTFATSTPPPPPPTTAPSTTAVPTSATLTTNSDGQQVTVIIATTASLTATSTSASSTATSAPDNNSGVGGKSIAGMVVAGVLALLGIAGFIYWKLTRKRFSGYDDDGDAIKWPELNNGNVESEAMRPLPNRSLGGKSDFDDSSSQVNLTGYGNAPPQAPYYDTQSVHTSTVDLHQGPLDPAHQQYYDHGNYPPEGVAGARESGYYDPYSGPVPQAFTPLAGTFPQGQAQDPSRQPGGPNVAYGGRAASPGPTVAYGGRAASPGPNTPYGGRQSPGPNMAYGERAANSGPNAAYLPGRVGSPGPTSFNPRSTSPGPNTAYSGGQGYVQRSGSPGPNAAYRTG